MKLKNVKIGMKVQVKEDAHIKSNWYESSVGLEGVVTHIDDSGHVSSVCVKHSNGSHEWGHHKGLRKVKGDK